MATSVTQKHLTGQKTVTSAGTAEAIDTSLGVQGIISALMIIAHDNNTGRVFYGGSDVASTTQRGLAAGESVSIESNHESPFDIAEIFLDVSVSGEGADFVATRSRRTSF